MGSSPFGEQHEWAMRELCEMTTKNGDRIGSRAIKSITPRGADKIYDRLTLGRRVQDCQPRRRLCFSVAKLGGSCIDLSEEFNKDVPNPWPGVPMKTRVKLTTPRHPLVNRSIMISSRSQLLGRAVAFGRARYCEKPDRIIGSRFVAAQARIKVAERVHMFFRFTPKTTSRNAVAMFVWYDHLVSAHKY
jgi:hypothetical protein